MCVRGGTEVCLGGSQDFEGAPSSFGFGRGLVPRRTSSFGGRRSGPAVVMVVVVVVIAAAAG